MNIFKKITPTLIIDGKNIENRMESLENLKGLNQEGEDKKINELKLLKMGLYGENQILFELLNSNIPMYIFHDVHFEFDENDAQIDFIVVTEYKIFVIECKNIIGNVIINSDGNFIREYYNIKEGMYSPITQNQRHIDLLIKLISSRQSIINKLLSPNLKNLFSSVIVFTNPKTIIKNKFASKEIKNKVIRADAVVSYIKSVIAKSSKAIDINSYANFFEFYNVPINKDYTTKYNKYVINDNNSVDVNAMRNRIKEDLINYRKLKASEENSRAYFIFTNEQLEDVLNIMPKNKEQLLSIAGFGTYKVDKYGNDIINIINNYSK